MSTAPAPALAVGSTVWVFDEYHSRRNWRDGWQPRRIVAETRVSWIVGEHRWQQFKLPKRDPRSVRCVAFSEAEIGDRAYVNDHKWPIANRIHAVDDATTLRAIAKLIGYDEATRR